jgi:cytochrome oxidase Cu insertion factor (SCO1/SenC/PrrC family)
MRMTMITNVIVSFVVTAVLFAAVACAAAEEKTEAKISPSEAGIQAAEKQNLYVFATFYKQNDEASTKMLEEAKKLQAQHSSRANFVSIDVADATNKELMTRYGVDRAPIPLTLVIAPNGAVTAGYPNKINKTDLSDAFVSNGMAAVLKILQGGKLAVICVQNSNTKLNKESLAAAEGLKNDAMFQNSIEIVKIDPSDSSETKLIQSCRVDANSQNAQLVVIAPPGRIVGTFDGTATTETITAALTKAFSGGTCGGGGCAPGGCGG